MNKQEIIDALNTRFSGVLSVVETSSKEQLEAALTLVEQSDKAAVLEEENVSLKEAIASKEEEVSDLQAQLIAANIKLSSSEKQKDESKPTVEHNGKKYKVRFGAKVAVGDKPREFTVDDIVKNEKVGESGETIIDLLVAIGAKCIKEV